MGSLSKYLRLVGAWMPRPKGGWLGAGRPSYLVITASSPSSGVPGARGVISRRELEGGSAVDGRLPSALNTRIASARLRSELEFGGDGGLGELEFASRVMLRLGGIHGSGAHWVRVFPISPVTLRELSGRPAGLQAPRSPLESSAPRLGRSSSPRVTPPRTKVPALSLPAPANAPSALSAKAATEANVCGRLLSWPPM
jgi:hypothetical protein